MKTSNLGNQQNLRKMKALLTIFTFALSLPVAAGSSVVGDSPLTEPKFLFVEQNFGCIQWIQSTPYGQYNPTLTTRVSCEVDFSKHSGTPIYSPSSKRHLSREVKWALDCMDRSFIRTSAIYFSGQFWNGSSEPAGLDPMRIPFSRMGDKLEMTLDYACGKGPRIWPPWVLQQN